MLKNYKLSTNFTQAMDLDSFNNVRSNVVDKFDEVKTLAINLKDEQNILKEENSSSRKLVDEINDIKTLKRELENFDGCKLKFGANNLVFADGVSSSEIMIIGEAPGAKEDEMGIPFCGSSGMLLDKMLLAIGISREKNCYITNTVFWRPPANRPPTQDEIEICRPFVEKHIALVNPKILILVGSTAVTSLLGSHLKISKVRQEYYSYTNQYLSEEITTTALFHPAYLLRQPMQKKTTWYDLLKIKEFIISRGIKI